MNEIEEESLLQQSRARISNQELIGDSDDSVSRRAPDVRQSLFAVSDEDDAAFPEQLAPHVAAPAGAAAPEPGDDFEKVGPAGPSMGDDLLGHVTAPRAPRGFLAQTFGPQDSPGTGRFFARMGQGLLGDSRAGTSALVAGQAGYNYDAVGIGANALGATNNVAKAMGHFTPTMMRDVLRGFGVHAQLAGRKMVEDSGEKPTDVAVPQRERYARHAQLFREIAERKRAGEAVPRNMLGRQLVNTALAASRLGREIDYMGHRSEYEYSMQESAGLNNRDAIREKNPVPRAGELEPKRPAETDEEYAARLDDWKKLNKKAVRFVPRAGKPQMAVTTAGEFTVKPQYQSTGEYRRGKFFQGLATGTTRAVDELGRVLQNEEAGIDDLRKGNNKRAALKAALHSARGVGVGVGSAMTPDPTGGMLAYPLIDAAARIGGAGVSALGQTVGNVTGLEAKAQRQDDIDLHNTHYFGKAKQIRGKGAGSLDESSLDSVEDAPEAREFVEAKRIEAREAAPLEESSLDLVDDAKEAREFVEAKQIGARGAAPLDESSMDFVDDAQEAREARGAAPLDEASLDLVDDAKEARDEMVTPQPTARAQAVLERGLRFRETADEIGSERAGLPQLRMGNAATNFLGQRLGRGNFNHWFRDNTTEPRIVGGIAWPILKAMYRGGAAVGRGAMRALNGVGNGLKWMFQNARYKREMAEARERKLARMREAGLIADAPAVADPGGGDPAAADPGAPPSLADRLAPELENKGADLEEQMRSIEEKSEDEVPLGGSQRGSQPGSQRGSQGNPSSRHATQLLGEGEAESVEPDPQDKEAAEDQALRDKLKVDGTRGRLGRIGRDYVVGEFLGFGKRDIAGENLRAWYRHLNARQIGTGQADYQEARKFDPAGYARAQAQERERTLAKLAAMPNMKAAMDRESAVRDGGRRARQAVDLGIGDVAAPDEEILQVERSSAGSSHYSDDAGDVPGGAALGSEEAKIAANEGLLEQVMNESEAERDDRQSVVSERREGSGRARQAVDLGIGDVAAPDHENLRVERSSAGSSHHTDDAGDLLPPRVDVGRRSVPLRPKPSLEDVPGGSESVSGEAKIPANEDLLEQVMKEPEADVDDDQSDTETVMRQVSGAFDYEGGGPTSVDFDDGNSGMVEEVKEAPQSQSVEGWATEQRAGRKLRRKRS